MSVFFNFFYLYWTHIYIHYMISKRYASFHHAPVQYLHKHSYYSYSLHKKIITANSIFTIINNTRIHCQYINLSHNLLQDIVQFFLVFFKRHSKKNRGNEHFRH